MTHSRSGGARRPDPRNTAWFAAERSGPTPPGAKHTQGEREKPRKNGKGLTARTHGEEYGVEHHPAVEFEEARNTGPKAEHGPKRVSSFQEQAENMWIVRLTDPRGAECGL